MGALLAILNAPRTVLTIMFVMVLAGVVTYVTIPKEADPNIDVPIFYVSIPYQGISPEDSERLLVKPMETALRGLDGLKQITAIASQGHAGIIVEFDIDIDHAEASADVREKVDQAKAELPSGAEEPSVNEINLSLFPVIVVALSGDVPERTLFQAARRLQDKIEAIPSVLEARLAGNREELLEVIVDPARLESYAISQDELVRAVTQNNQLIAAGNIDTGQGRFNVKVPGLFENARDVGGIPVKVSDLGIVTLADVAEVRRTFKDPVSYSRFNGKPAIAIEVVKRTGTNIVENNAAVRQVVAEFTADWPKTIEVDLALDQSKFIFEVLGSLEAAILTAIALVMIVVVAALGLRSALLVGFAIPASFMIGFLIIGLTGMTVNMMLMFGMVLTVGILVDGAIVIVEYADRRMGEGVPPREAYNEAATRMFWPIVSSTATTLAAFMPLLLWPGVPGEFMSYLPITVIIVLSASLVTAMIFLPVLGGLLTRRDHALEAVASASRSAEPVVPDGLYVRMMRRLIRHPILVLLATIGLVVGSFMAYSAKPTGVEFFVDTEPEQAIVFISARGNLAAREELALVSEVEREVLAVAGIKAVFTRTGGGTGGPEMGTGVSDAPADQIGMITIELADYNTRRVGKEILEEIRTRVADIPGITVEVRKREDGPPVGKPIRLEVAGSDRAVVEAVTARVRGHLETGMTGLRDIEDSRPLPGIEWVVTVDRGEAGRYGTDIASVGAMIQLVTNGILVGKYRPDDSEDEVDIRVRLPEADRTLDQLDQLRIVTPAGMVPITNFVTREPRPRVNTIERKDGFNIMSVKANVAEGILGDEKVRELDAWLKSEQWPAGITFTFRGADEEQKESGAFLGKAMAAALFIMFIILVTQFNSFSQAGITLSTIVLSVAGVLLGMLITRQPFSIIMTGTGVVALAGIVVNNSIVLIDTFNHLRRVEGYGTIDAVLRSCAERFRPVFLTTITTIFGLLPMAMQVNVDFFTPQIALGSITSIWWVQLSTAIISGLLFSTLITLVLTPTLLAWPAVYGELWSGWRAWFARMRQARAERLAAGASAARDRAGAPIGAPSPAE
ncbi:MAG: AcrB/AcrD/AcrF family protein [Rhizobiales bacterium]|nr:AcrB/AcrD/AcrF family protein [Hyphomicrobiales bacterium]